MKDLRRRSVVAAIFGGMLALVWAGYPWLTAAGTYRVTAFFGLVISASAFFHVKAAVKFNRMAKLIEASTVATAGDLLFAANQRFRYVARVIEACIAAGLMVLSAWATKDPAIAANRWYGAYVLTYFIGTVALTGYLTYRDLDVITKARQLDAEHSEAVRLAGFGDGRGAPPS